ncbi:unnamed protein product [Paramecium pentaurelia]|uniref:PNPLA domain-containing protein n=1 Tax=Paramecium pentaurelia TaxID=43138 RepID=A0A8S1TKD2_9CILI|nr:unnamed protein product [Paramecium pentaurelia]
MNIIFKLIKYLLACITMFFEQNRKRQKSLKIIDKEENYEKWLELVKEHDQQDYIQQWLQKEESNLYQYKYIKSLSQKLRMAKQDKNIPLICQLLRQNANRNIGNILNPKLYSHAFMKTKNLIEEFQEEYENCLEFLYNSEFPNKIQFFQELQKAIGQTALLFSGGAIMGLYSCGIANILDKLHLLPKVMTGSSAGAILVSLVGTATDIQTIFQPKYYDYSMFEQKTQFDILDKISRLLTKGYMLEKEQMQQFLQKAYGDVTFLEAYKKTGKIMNIMVTGKDCSSSDCLLNYITSPNVIVWSAVCCSCSLPGVYGASHLYYKNEQGEIYEGEIKYVDGSISADLPMQQLAEQFNINYTIVSQTNPWVFPFLTSHRSDHTIIKKITDKLLQFILGEIKYRIQQIISIGFLPKMLCRMSNLLIQKYEGNITIWPKFLWLDYSKLLDNPDEFTVQRMKVEGQRRTYEKLHFIYAATRLERCLSKYLN